jgi:hypothetical protein
MPEATGVGAKESVDAGNQNVGNPNGWPWLQSCQRFDGEVETFFFD